MFGCLAVGSPASNPSPVSRASVQVLNRCSGPAGPDAMGGQPLVTAFDCSYLVQPFREKIMFTHIMIGSNDLEQARRFYDATFAALGGKPSDMDARDRLIYNYDGAG